MRDTVNEYKIFKKMYLKLFNAVTDALSESDTFTKDYILKKAQQECEEIFINNEV